MTAISKTFGIAIAAALMTAASVQAGPVRQSGEDTVSRDEAMQLAGLLCAQLRSMKQNEPADQYEANIVFLLSQQTSALEIQRRALRKLPEMCELSGAMNVGLANANAAVARGATTGSAGLSTGRGLSSGSAFGNGNSAFSSPSINVGGGSVNYSTPR
jgi:hypothetical protein